MGNSLIYRFFGLRGCCCVCGVEGELLLRQVISFGEFVVGVGADDVLDVHNESEYDIFCYTFHHMVNICLQKWLDSSLICSSIFMSWKGVCGGVKVYLNTCEWVLVMCALWVSVPQLKLGP